MVANLVAYLVARKLHHVTFFDMVWLITRGGPGGATEHWPIWIYQETMGFFRFGTGAALAAGLILGGNAHARINDAEDEAVFIAPQINADSAALWRKLDTVMDQVDPHLTQQILIGGDSDIGKV